MQVQSAGGVERALASDRHVLSVVLDESSLTKA